MPFELAAAGRKTSITDIGDNTLPGDRRTARNRIVEENLNLVYTCANRFRGRGAEYDDMFQAGCIGLIKAAERFDSARGFAFSTYAVPVILGEIRMLFREGGAVKIGRTLREQAREALRVRDELAEERGEEPPLHILAERLGIDCAQTAELLGVFSPTVPLYQTDADGEERVLEIAVSAPDEKITDSIALHQELDGFCERDRSLLILRYYKGFTQSRTAELLGMTQVQVSRREKTLLMVLRGKLTA
ncbi:MAG: sigma-70 family RNA polymerase sigma factor [Oscillospiraceae bacterium]|jgi:RNA polymerase sporulation-specific sigma factor|nr:sigma-70 family RNA polymerase sigma factor [Oscillospiraceae bacterium]